jgi:hypothetical protein
LLCRNRDVVEFGLGGSTLIIGQVAKSLITYETKPEWVKRFPRIESPIEIIEEKKDGSSVKGLGRECDVIFLDGWAAMRHHFLLEFWPHIRECAILHDTRSVYAANCLKKFIDAYNPPTVGWALNPYLATLKSIDWNFLESNMCILHKRNCQLEYEDWKKTEAGNNREGFGCST